GDDRAQEEIVSALRAANGCVPWTAIAGPNVKNVGGVIIGHTVPNGTAAAHLPPLASPCLGRHFQFRMFEWFRRIARHRAEAPDLLARSRVVRRKESACGIIGPA